MPIGGVVFLLAAAAFLLLAPRRLAIVPILMTAAYTARNPVIELGPASFSALRVLVLVGGLRILLRGERPAGGLNAVDVLLLCWASLLILSSLFHSPDAWTFRLGLVLGELGSYLLFRCFLQGSEDVRRTFKYLTLALAPLAVLMLLEKINAHNYFGVMGTGELIIRDGHVRAYGPFGHPILAGTVGATCVPIAIYIASVSQARALIGLFTALAILIASTSSGPVMMVLFSLAGLSLWKLRRLIRPIRWAAVAAIGALQLVMNDPVYFLMARIDFTGSSTGWFRSQLIRSSIEHLQEWWLFGTDFTRHWMATGIYANANHTDMTNHLLQMGVWGGLPLLATFVAVLIVAFRAVGRTVTATAASPADRFLAWTLGTILFGQFTMFWSISFFDQSISFFYFILASIGAVGIGALHRRAPESSAVASEAMLARRVVRIARLPVANNSGSRSLS